jgi:aquaporin Z
MARLVTEGIGTFFLTLIILMAKGPMAALAIGCTLMALMYAGAKRSGVHYNPAVSLAMLVQGRLQRDDLPGLIFVQFAGALLAAIAAGFLLTFTVHPDVELRTNHVLGALMAEFIGTFTLTYVFLHVAHPDEVAKHPYYGLAIGGAMIGLTLALAEVSGAVFNPAVALGLAIGEHLAWSDLWIYFVASPLGAAAASTVFTLQQKAA